MLCTYLLLLVSALASSTGQTQSSRPAAAAETYRIAGRVVNAATGAPLANAAVAILTVVDGVRQEPEQDTPRRTRRGGGPGFGGRRGSPRTAAQSTVTGDDGTFIFEQVAPGKYSLEGSRRGFITASYQEHGLYSTAIVVGPGLPSENLSLQLSPGAVIAGTVSDGVGDPVERANVTLYRLADDGLGSIRNYRGANTDDLGAYEFAHLPPGTYFVSTTARVWYAGAAQPRPSTTDTSASGSPTLASPSLDLVYPRTYYADATDSASATPVPLRGVEHLRVDMHMQAVPAVHLTYNLPPRDPGVASFGRQPAFSQSVFGERESVGDTVVRMDDHGRESLSIGLAPGEYEAEVGGRTVSVNAAGDAVLDASAGQPTVDVTGKLAAAPGETLPETVGIALQPADGHGSSAQSTVARQGEFHFEQVRPGAYEIELQSESRTMAIVQAAASGAQLDGNLVHVGTQPVALAATVAMASGIVSGFAQTVGNQGKPASGAMIVLVPEHLGNRALYRRDQSDSDGSFTLSQVAAGSYTLLAIADGWDLEWARPEVIARYLPRGQVVTVAAGSGSIHLQKPVVVQPH